MMLVLCHTECKSYRDRERGFHPDLRERPGGPARSHRSDVKSEWRSQEVRYAKIMSAKESFSVWLQPAQEICSRVSNCQGQRSVLPKLFGVHILSTCAPDGGYGGTGLNIRSLGFCSCFSPIISSSPILPSGMEMFALCHYMSINLILIFTRVYNCLFALTLRREFALNSGKMLKLLRLHLRDYCIFGWENFIISGRILIVSLLGD